MDARQGFFYASVATEVLGLAVALSALFPSGLEVMMTVAYGPGAPTVPLGPGQLGIGLTGAVMAGWGAAMALIARAWPKFSPRVMANAFIAGLGLWFLTDNAVSITLGAYLNVVGNTAFLAMLLIPLLKLRKQG